MHNVYFKVGFFVGSEMILHHLYVFLIELVRFCGGVGDLEIALPPSNLCMIDYVEYLWRCLYIYHSNEHIDSLT